MNRRPFNRPNWSNSARRWPHTTRTSPGRRRRAVGPTSTPIPRSTRCAGFRRRSRSSPLSTRRAPLTRSGSRSAVTASIRAQRHIASWRRSCETPSTRRTRRRYRRFPDRQRRQRAAEGGNGVCISVAAFCRLLAILALVPCLVHAQAGPRTDTPRAGILRVTFEPVITTWEREFTTDGHEQGIGVSLFSETHPPYVCSTVKGFLACRYDFTSVFVREERRVTPLAVELGITDRIAVGVYLPLVRVNTRAGFQLDSAGNPGAPAA